MGCTPRYVSRKYSKNIVRTQCISESQHPQQRQDVYRQKCRCHGSSSPGFACQGLYEGDDRLFIFVRRLPSQLELEHGVDGVAKRRSATIVKEGCGKGRPSASLEP